MNRRDFIRSGVGVLGTTMAGTSRVAGWAHQEPRTVTTATGGLLRLNSNENPLGLAPAAREAIGKALGSANRYPDGPRRLLLEKLARRHGVSPANLVLGNGSTEILQMIVQAGSSPNARLVLADPTFEAMSRYQRPLPYEVEKVPLDDGFGHDIGRMREMVEARRRPAVVYLCNPNNPTGTLTSSAQIDTWIEEAPETVLFAVDEAYFEYVRAPGYWSAIKWIHDRPNVIVVRTFSKIFGMAGLRLGYAFAHPDTAARLREFMSSDNANSLALAAASASLDDGELIERSRQANVKAMKVVQSCLEELELGYLPSQANFLMHRIGGELGAYIARMRERGFRVGRPFPPMLDHNRLSMGSVEEMERFVEVLREFRSRGWV